MSRRRDSALREAFCAETTFRYHPCPPLCRVMVKSLGGASAARVGEPIPGEHASVARLSFPHPEGDGGQSAVGGDALIVVTRSRRAPGSEGRRK